MICSKVSLCWILFGLLFLNTSGQRDLLFFRKDYTYLLGPESFYKIHTIHRTWIEAKKMCALEGASIFYPENEAEANAVIEHWNKTQPFSWVYIGVSDTLAKGVYETFDGHPIADVYNKWSPGEPNDADGEEDCVILRREGTLNDDRCDKKYPFICKKSLNTLEWNLDCDMPNTDYVKSVEQGKCYKFHLAPTNWSEAYRICSAEQSYLAVPNSQAEADYLVKLTSDAPKDNIGGNYLAGAVFLGFHNKDGEGWKTIKGTTLEDSGYATWSPNQPDGGEREKCGSMFYNGQLNDLSCSHRCFFICEHDIGTLSESFDDRLSDA